jgi:hypothetical protein
MRALDAKRDGLVVDARDGSALVVDELVDITLAVK